MISTNSLQYSYERGPSFGFPDIVCDVRSQFLILGQSVVGKSTILHLLGGLMAPTAGKVIIGDTDITKLTARQMDAFRGNQIGVVFQQNHFVASLSVLENLQLAHSLTGGSQSSQRCPELLDRLQIKHKADQNTASLSHRIEVFEK